MVDLHMHSLYSSDGEFAPRELAAMCSEAGVTHMALSDHDTVAGIAEAAEAAASAGIRCCSAVEIDCRFRGTDLHMLGYRIDPADPGFAEIERNLRAQYLSASRIRLEAVNALGFSVGEEEIRALCENSYVSEEWTGERFAELLLGRREYADDPILLPYRPGGSRCDNPYVNFYWDYFSAGKPCFVPLDYPEAEAVVALIRRSGGLAVLAHPGQSLRGREELLGELIDAGLDGIEAFSSYHSASKNALFERAARDAGLLATCGSDFHGKTKPAIRLGRMGFSSAGERRRFEAPILERLFPR